MELKEAYQIVLKDLMKCELFRGIYDGKTESLDYMCGIGTLMSCISTAAGREGYVEIFEENLIKSNGLAEAAKAMEKETGIKRLCILGTWYNLIEHSPEEDPRLSLIDGYCDVTARKLVVDKMEPDPENPALQENLEALKREVIRHEILHAFLYESGLSTKSWGENEEIIDFFAVQFPKLASIFKEADVFEFHDPDT